MPLKKEHPRYNVITSRLSDGEQAVFAKALKKRKVSTSEILRKLAVEWSEQHGGYPQ